jgi:hypothetical protein
LRIFVVSKREYIVLRIFVLLERERETRERDKREEREPFLLVLAFHRLPHMLSFVPKVVCERERETDREREPTSTGLRLCFRSYQRSSVKEREKETEI